nr:hypothetical protein OH837_42575 [Streptomyces canus]
MSAPRKYSLELRERAARMYRTSAPPSQACPGAVNETETEGKKRIQG